MTINYKFSFICVLNFESVIQISSKDPITHHKKENCDSNFKTNHIDVKLRVNDNENSLAKVITFQRVFQ